LNRHQPDDRLSLEIADFLRVPPNRGFGLLGGAVAEPQPDDFGRVASHQAEVSELMLAVWSGTSLRLVAPFSGRAQSG
jgi:hypothetical protein